VTGNEKLTSEHDKLKHHYEGLEAELSEARSDAQKRMDDLVARVGSVEAHSINIAADNEKSLEGFRG
jgi:hemerythrin-like domain-containing protein